MRKHLICLLLAVCLGFSGCSMMGEWVKEPVTFYYVRENYKKDMNQVLASEIREAAGHRDDLPYLLALYSIGPSREDLVSPFPRNTRIIPITRTNDSIELSLSDNVLVLSEAEFTLASACIAMTCMEITTAEKVIVVCEDRRISIDKDNLLLYSDMIQKPQEETE